ncbi:MAG: ABC transporter ATP-binding protein [Pseudonocardiales bacterium]|nr:MAG: ABC transporter ATP-binding protein [Pseudonocardiales bacterium]
MPCRYLGWRWQVRAESDPADGRDADALRCRGVCVDYGGAAALADVDLTIARGEVVALLGASGSGKSTLLHAVAGLVPPSRGEIWVAGQRVASAGHSMPPERRDVGMVFQNFALWPHLSVLDTVAYPLRRAKRPRREAAATARTLLARLGIEHLAARRPAQLSGGEQQRVGLARALARDARLYLLDEPTAHLDTHLRAAFQESVLARQRDTGAAVVYATHDAAEALALADRVALIVDGRLIQIDTPQTVYGQPVSVAAAVLTGPCSVLKAVVGVGSDGMLSVDLGAGPVAVAGGPACAAAPRPRELLVRPDWAREGGPLRGRITAVGFRGPLTEYRVTTPAGPILLQLPGAPHHGVGQTLSWALARGWVIDVPTPGPAEELPQPRAMMAPE